MKQIVLFVFEAMKKIRRSYPKGHIELTEQDLDLREYNRYQLSWLLAI